MVVCWQTISGTTKRILMKLSGSNQEIHIYNHFRFWSIPIQEGCHPYSKHDNTNMCKSVSCSDTELRFKVVVASSFSHYTKQVTFVSRFNQNG